MRSKLVALCFVLSCTVAYGGAWGTGAFDNDDALDWVWELESSSGVSVLEAALEDVTSSFFYISAPECSRAIAAAEIVAALIGNPGPDLPENVKSWVANNDVQIDAKTLELARTAVTLVRDSSKSELAALWRDSGANHDDWLASMSDLIERLS